MAAGGNSVWSVTVVNTNHPFTDMFSADSPIIVEIIHFHTRFIQNQVVYETNIKVGFRPTRNLESK